MNYDVFKILVLIIVVALIALVLKSYRPEFSFLLTVGAIAVILLKLIAPLFPAIRGISESFKNGGVSLEYFSVALKALGIAYMTSFVADVCRDFGQSALASKAEFAGKCAIFLLCVPLINGVLQTALNIANL